MINSIFTSSFRNKNNFTVASVLGSILFTALLITITGCATNPPETVDEDFSTGRIFVSSNIPGAEIYLNGSFTGKLTPDTITSRIGLANLLLKKTGYIPSSLQVNVLKDSTIPVFVPLNASAIGKTVLLEEFSNVSCIPCVATNQILNKLHNSAFSKEQLIIVKYSSNFPSPQDPHYLHSKADFDGRLSYYFVISTPTIYVNGSTSPVPSDSNSIKNAITAELQTSSKFILQVSDTIHDGGLNITITVNNIDSSGLDFSRLTVHTLIIEDEITYTTPPGANGETTFKHVVRKMLPSKDGESLNAANILNSKVLTRSIALNPAWNVQQLRTIVFVQDKISKKIYQSASSH